MKTVKQQIEVMQGVVEGNGLEVLRKNAVGWVEISTPNISQLNWVDNDYRIKREPEVVYMIKFDDGHKCYLNTLYLAEICLKQMEDNCCIGGTIIMMREVKQ